MVTSDLGDHSDKVMRESLGGKPMDVEIRFVKGGKPYLTIKLNQALITSYSVSGPGGGVARQADRVLDAERHEDRVRGRQGAGAAGSPPE